MIQYKKRITMKNLKLVFVISHFKKLSQIQFSLATTDQNTFLHRLYVHKNNLFLFVLHSIHDFSSFLSSCFLSHFPQPHSLSTPQKGYGLLEGVNKVWQVKVRKGHSPPPSLKTEQGIPP